MDFLRLAAYLKLDKSEYDESLKDAEKGAKGFGSKFASGIGNVTKAIGAATVAGAAAVGKIASSAASAYANYEQLLGGVKKLYGTAGQSIEEYAASVGKSVADVKEEYNRLQDAQFTVIENADKAARTVGMSSNQYMETATQFSASLINSLSGDVQKAADLTDVAMRAMADNYNTFGSDMESVSNAFLGFSKQNYTMLDNLKLGYGGTKQEMARLIKDANAYAKAIGQAGDLSMDSFADIVTAIDLIQQKQNIAGTSAKEASTTITGSLNTIKAEWENLKVAMAEGQGLDGYIKDLVEDVGQFAQNVIPVFTQAIEGVGQLIEAIVPIISERLPELVESVLPGLLSAAASLVQGVVNALPALLQTLLKTLPDLIKQIITTIRKVLPDILKAIVSGLKTFIPEMLKMGTELLTELANGMGDGSKLIDTIIELFNTIIQAITDNLPQILQAGLTIIEKLALGIVDNIDKVVDAILLGLQSLLKAIIEHLPDFLSKGAEILHKLIQGIVDNIPQIVQTIVQVVTTLIQTIVDHLPEILQAGVQILIELSTGLVQAIPELIKAIPQIIQALCDNLLSGDMIEKLLQAGLDIISNIFDGILSGDFLGTLADIGKALLGAVGAAVGSLVSLGGAVVGKILEGIKGAWHTVVSWVTDAWSWLTGSVNVEGIVETVGNAEDARIRAFIPGGGKKSSNSGSTPANYGDNYKVTVNNYMGGTNTGKVVADSKKESDWRGSY